MAIPTPGPTPAGWRRTAIDTAGVDRQVENTHAQPPVARAATGFSRATVTLTKKRKGAQDRPWGALWPRRRRLCPFDQWQRALDWPGRAAVASPAQVPSAATHGADGAGAAGQRTCRRNSSAENSMKTRRGHHVGAVGLITTLPAGAHGSCPVLQRGRNQRAVLARKRATQPPKGHRSGPALIVELRSTGPLSCIDRGLGLVPIGPLPAVLPQRPLPSVKNTCALAAWRTGSLAYQFGTLLPRNGNFGEGFDVVDQVAGPHPARPVGGPWSGGAALPSIE